MGTVSKREGENLNEYNEDLMYMGEQRLENFSHDEALFLISFMIWSFSRLNSYYHCPYEWKMKYLCGKYGAGSAMAQHGSFVHEIFEKYFKGELGIFELPIYYEDHYNENVTMPFPHNNYVDLAEKYYQQGLEFFENFPEHELASEEFNQKYEILGVEKEVKFQYKGYEFVGYIDLLLRDKSDGKLIILDHKSSALKILKSGKIGKGDIAHFEEFKKQLYLYSNAVMEEFGPGSVKALKWNLFRLGVTYEIPWKEKEFMDAMKWAANTIETIENDTDFDYTDELTKAMMDGKYPPFYCMNLCSQRDGCPFKEECINALKGEDDFLEETDF